MEAFVLDVKAKYNGVVRAYILSDYIKAEVFVSGDLMRNLNKLQACEKPPTKRCSFNKILLAQLHEEEYDRINHTKVTVVNACDENGEIISAKPITYVVGIGEEGFNKALEAIGVTKVW